ncbi:MAG TPA: YMGG-like glycine zipper-containing protein [Thermoanaerobaculia bacterium]|nr:YMGG-like glycine zipper-containing protein [Thermoanaerobaculia bacterium]
MNKQRVFIALLLLGFLCFGSAAALAEDTKGADRLVKGAAIGAAAGAVTQAIRGRRTGKELVKGAAVGGAVGAAVGAYSDYKQEREAREDEKRRADWAEYQASRRGGRARYYDNGQAYYAGNNRAARAGHVHNRRCRH